MPNWKLVVTSGSDASLNSLNITSGSTITGSLDITGYIKLNPENLTIDSTLTGSYIYVSGSTNDLYFTQNSAGYNNTTRLRWLEGNLYTGLLNGGLITVVTGSTTFNVSSGSGIIVNLNASLADNPYPTIQYVNWGNYTSQSLTYLTSSIQTYLGIDSNGSIIQQTTPWFNGEYNTSISIGTVLHQNQSTINGSITYPNVAYGYKQRTYDFIKAFGPLKLSGYTIVPSSSLGLTVGSGTAFADGRNYQVDPNNPSYIVDPGTAVSKIFRYYQSGSSFVQDTNGGVGYTVIDPGNYNVNGTLTPVPGTGSNRRWSIQRVFWYPNSATKGIVVYYGNATYASSTDAIANIAYETFNETPNTQQNAVYLGALVLRNNAVFTNSATYVILPAGIFRSVGGSGGGGSVPSTLLSSLADVLISGPTDGQALVYNTNDLKWENKSFISASISGNAATATSASYALSASQAQNANTASYVQTAQTASYVLNAISASYATQALSASYSLTSTSASYSNNSTSASYALNSTSASYASTALSSSYALSASYAPSTPAFPFTGSAIITGSLSVIGPMTSSFNALINSIPMGRASGSNARNIAIGLQAGAANNTNGANNPNIYIGYQAGLSNTTGYSQVFIGTQAGQAQTGGDDNIAIGYRALYRSIDTYYNIAIGSEAGSNLTNIFGAALNNVFLGHNSGKATAGASGNNVLIGTNTAGFTVTGSMNRNAIFGPNTAYYLSSGSNNTAVGYQALFNNVGSSFNIGLGSGAGSLATIGNYNMWLGSFDGTGFTTVSNNIFISDGQGNVRIRIPSTGNVLINTTTDAGTTKLQVNGGISTPGTTNNTYRWDATSGTPTNTATPAGWVKISVAGADAWLPYYQ